MGDVMRLEVAASTEATGVSLEDLAAAVVSGDLSLGYLDALPHPAPLLPQTGYELAHELGVTFMDRSDH